MSHIYSSYEFSRIFNLDITLNFLIKKSFSAFSNPTKKIITPTIATSIITSTTKATNDAGEANK